jgi:hypothetical protein
MVWPFAFYLTNSRHARQSHDPLPRNRLSAGRDEMEKIAQAIETLNDLLPAHVAVVQRHIEEASRCGEEPFWPPAWLPLLQALAQAIPPTRPIFAVHRRVAQARARPGRRRIWASDAEMIAWFARNAWRQAGRVAPLGSNPAGPLVSVIVPALEYLGYPADSDANAKWPAAIAKWLEGRKAGKK